MKTTQGGTACANYFSIHPGVPSPFTFVHIIHHFPIVITNKLIFRYTLAFAVKCLGK